MVIAHGAGGASQQALGTSVMGGMIAVVILALLMVPVFFVSVQRVLAGIGSQGWLRRRPSRIGRRRPRTDSSLPGVVARLVQTT